MKPLTIILIDGLAAEVAREAFSFHTTCKAFDPAFRTVECVVPSSSLCTWYSLFSGLSPMDHQVISTGDRFRRVTPPLLKWMKEPSRRSVVVGHYLLFEILEQRVFDPFQHSFQSDGQSTTMGFFYDNSFPLGLVASEPSAQIVFGMAACLEQRCDPKVTLVHYDQIDLIGHMYGRGKEYYAAIHNLNEVLVDFFRRGRDTSVVVTADHGQTANGIHGGWTEAERRVPLLLTPDLATCWNHWSPKGSSQEQLGRLLLEWVEEHG